MGSLDRKRHVLLLPIPAQGHVNPLMQLAKLLHSRGFYITFVNTEFNHGRLLRSKGPDFFKSVPEFRFETIPDGLPPSNKDATQEVWSLCDSLRKNCLVPFRELVVKLNSEPEVPGIDCIIADGLMVFATEVAKELGIKEVPFWTASACGLMGYLQYAELISRGIVPFEDENFANDGTLDMPLEWIQGMSNMRLKDIPFFIRTTNRDDVMLNYMKDGAENCANSTRVIVNSFYELESQALDAIAAKVPNLYAMGPLSMLEKHMPSSYPSSFMSNLWKEDWSCLQWLDQKEPDSVIYVNYGSIATMSDKHFIEFAWGLANSKHNFLWVVRPDAVASDSEKVNLPEEYYKEIEDRGCITTWCPQDQVVSHPAVAAFLTHCGWNSTLEGMCAGLPLLCWPFFGEQPTNSRYACTVWKNGLEVNPEIIRNEIEALVKEVMENEKGKCMKEKALEWKKKVEEACDIGGTSYKDFDRFIQEVLLS